jgi:hypothetical protein
MRLFALVALIILGCDPAAIAAAAVPQPFAISSSRPADLHFARWYHRRHGEGFWGWSQTEDGERANANGSSQSQFRIPEATRPTPRRRGDWVDPPPLK